MASKSPSAQRPLASKQVASPGSFSDPVMNAFRGSSAARGSSGARDSVSPESAAQSSEKRVLELKSQLRLAKRKQLDMEAKQAEAGRELESLRRENEGVNRELRNAESSIVQLKGTVTTQRKRIMELERMLSRGERLPSETASVERQLKAEREAFQRIRDEDIRVVSKLQQRSAGSLKHTLPSPKETPESRAASSGQTDDILASLRESRMASMENKLIEKGTIIADLECQVMELRNAADKLTKERNVAVAKADTLERDSEGLRKDLNSAIHENLIRDRTSDSNNHARDELPGLRLRVQLLEGEISRNKAAAAAATEEEEAPARESQNGSSAVAELVLDESSARRDIEAGQGSAIADLLFAMYSEKRNTNTQQQEQQWEPWESL